LAQDLWPEVVLFVFGGVVKDSFGMIPRDPVPGMPDELLAAIWRLDETSAEIAIANWEAIGERGRDVYRAYLSLAWFRRTRRQRCDLAAQQLLTPYDGLAIPNVGGGG
jgi:hypothetical protein